MKIKKFMLTKKLIKNIDKDIKVKLGKDFECDIEKRVVYLPIKPNENNDLLFKKWYRKYYGENLQKDKLYLISTLHEVGHLMTYTEELDNQRDEEWAVTRAALELGVISLEQANFDYFEIPMELKATEWGKNYLEKLLTK